MLSNDPILKDLVEILRYIASKEDFIWWATRKNNELSEELKGLATRFLDAANGFSPDPNINGEFRLLQLLSGLNFKTVFDVGTHTGNWALAARQYFPQAKIHAFEISPTTFQMTQQQLQGENFILNNFGLANTTAHVHYKDYEPASAFNTLLNNATFYEYHLSAKTLSANVTTGDAYCDTCQVASIDYLKIDVEGAEHVVVMGFDEMLKARKIRCLQFEYGYQNGDSYFLMKDFFGFLNERGYIVGKVYPDGVEFTNFHYELNNFNSGPQFLAIPAYDTDLIKLLKRHK